MSSAGAWPVCDHCGARIPQFAGLSESDAARVRQLIREMKPQQAARELAHFVGCDPRLARLWVEHRGSPLQVRPGPPCPSCGEPVATSMAKQCLKCGADWHASTKQGE